MKNPRTADQNSSVFPPQDALSPLAGNCSPAEKVSFLFALFMLSLFPLMVGIKGYSSITEFKYQCFTVLVLLFFTVTLLTLLGHILSTSRRKRALLPSITLPQVLLIAYFISAAVSALFSPYHYNVWMGEGRYEGLLSLLYYGIVFLLLSFFGKYSEWYLWGLSGAAILMSLLALPQLVGKNPLSLYPGALRYSNGCPFISTLGNIDLVSGFAALALPAIACGYILLHRKAAQPLFLTATALLFFVQLSIDVDSGKVGLLAALLLFLPLLFTGQERIRRILELGALLSLVTAVYRLFPITNADGQYSISVSLGKQVILLMIVALLLAGLALLLRLRPGLIRLSPRVLRRAMILLLLLLIIGGVLFLYFYEGESKLFTQASDFLHGNLADHYGSGRGYVWKKSLLLIQEAPLFGSGPDTFVFRFKPFNEEYNAIMGTNVFFDFAHNDFLQIGVNYGLVGLLFYLAFLASLAVRMFRAAARNPIVLLFGAAVTGYLAHSFFSFSIAILTPLFWVMAGLLDHCIRETPSPTAAGGIRSQSQEEPQ